MFNYYTMADEQEMRFYQFPKALLSNDRYKTLSHGAKIAYTVFRDRQDLSRKNNWVDENGCIYLIFTNEHMADILNVTEKTVISYKKELSDHDLLKERRMGLGRPNRIYIGKTNDEYESPQVNTTVQTSNDYRSRQVNTPALKLTLGKGNDTDFNETDINDTNTTTTIGGEDEVKRIDTTLIMKEWNKLDDPIPKIVTLNSGTKRYKSLKSRIEEFGEENVLRAIDNVSRSDFLKGNNNNKWTIDFDWFIRPNNFIKVLEGNYENKEAVVRTEQPFGLTEKAQSNIQRMREKYKDAY